MKKAYKYNVLSDVKCSNHACKRRLKQRIVEQKPTADVCYPCFQKKQAMAGKRAYHFYKNSGQEDSHGTESTNQ
ncbi:hypothetical protein AYK24_06675 [Thermoplasmatales archaeon SG8-52-4]|nr:MAG: hypothetical protein AYK24_06675 [Thermoplasmatales archaeon SG8-52-4]